MGYTHYWKIKRDLNKSAWKRFCEDADKIISTAIINDIEINPAIDGVGGGRVFVNGINDDAHEDFILRPYKTDFEFCKTARKPYDEVVTAILIAAKRWFRDDIEITSDGQGEEWSAGQYLCQTACGYGEGPSFIIGSAGVEIIPAPTVPPEWYDGGEE